MALLSSLRVAALASSPAATRRRCATARSAASAAEDCARGQVCGSDGMCAAPGDRRQLRGDRARRRRPTRDAPTRAMPAPASTRPPADAARASTAPCRSTGTRQPSTLDRRRRPAHRRARSTARATARSAPASRSPRRRRAIELDHVFAMWTSPACGGTCATLHVHASSGDDDQRAVRRDRSARTDADARRDVIAARVGADGTCRFAYGWRSARTPRHDACDGATRTLRSASVPRLAERFR